MLTVIFFLNSYANDNFKKNYKPNSNRKEAGSRRKFKCIYLLVVSVPCRPALSSKRYNQDEV